MRGVQTLLLVLATSSLVWSAAVVPAAAPEDNEVEGRSEADDAGWRLAVKLLADCAERDVLPCLGVKAAVAMGRAARMSDIKLADGVSFVRVAGDEERGLAVATEAEMQNAIDREEPARRTTRLVDLLLEAASRFLKTHSLQFKLPDEVPQQIQRALQDEGRGKKKLLKTLLPVLLGIGGKVLLLVPLGLVAVGVLAFKALIVSKIALVIGAILAIQKLLAGRGSGGSGWAAGGSSGGWSSAPAAVGSGWSAGGPSSGPGASAGWAAARSLDAHDVAYSAYVPHSKEE